MLSLSTAAHASLRGARTRGFESLAEDPVRWPAGQSSWARGGQGAHVEECLGDGVDHPSRRRAGPAAGSSGATSACRVRGPSGGRFGRERGAPGVVELASPAAAGASTILRDRRRRVGKEMSVEAASGEAAVERELGGKRAGAFFQRKLKLSSLRSALRTWAWGPRLPDVGGTLRSCNAELRDREAPSAAARLRACHPLPFPGLRGDERRSGRGVGARVRSIVHAWRRA